MPPLTPNPPGSAKQLIRKVGPQQPARCARYLFRTITRATLLIALISPAISLCVACAGARSCWLSRPAHPAAHVYVILWPCVLSVRSPLEKCKRCDMKAALFLLSLISQRNTERVGHPFFSAPTMESANAHICWCERALCVYCVSARAAWRCARMIKFKFCYAEKY